VILWLDGFLCSTFKSTESFCACGRMQHVTTTCDWIPASDDSCDVIPMNLNLSDRLLLKTKEQGEVQHP
jgi:hypothetical protein